jgi:hypothetical protein
LGEFEFDAPKGWEVERDDGAIVVTERDAAWVWAFAIEDARALQEHEGGLTGASQAIARDVVTEEQSHDSGFSIGEPVTFDLGEGIVAVMMEGRAVVEGLEVGVRVLIAIAGGEALIGIGFRGPAAGEGEDAKSERLVRSVRLR